VIETSKTRPGANHPDTLTAMANLAYMWKGLGRDAEAIQLMKECVQRQSRILGVKHPQFSSCHVMLGRWEAYLVRSNVWHRKKGGVLPRPACLDQHREGQDIGSP